MEYIRGNVMGSRNIFSRRIVIGIIIIILLLILGIGLDMNTALLISLGFGLSISLWKLSYKYEQYFEYYQANR